MKERLPKKTMILWQIRLLIIALLPLIILFALSLLTSWILIAAAVWLIFSGVFVFWYIPRYFKSYEIMFPNGAIVINRGVFFKTTHIMPFSRLVYAKSYASPLAERMGLAGLSLKAARSSVIIPELTASDVNYFLEFVLKESEE